MMEVQYLVMIPNVITHVVLKTNINLYRVESKIILQVFSPQNKDVGNSFINTLCYMITKLLVIFVLPQGRRGNHASRRFESHILVPFTCGNSHINPSCIEIFPHLMRSLCFFVWVQMFSKRCLRFHQR